MVLLLEIARGLAALWVFLFHVPHLFKTSLPWITSFAELGYLGVPMFFVISGFVITYSAESMLGKNEKPTLFLKKRLIRIYPVFWGSVIIVILLPWLIEAISMVKSGAFITPNNLLKSYSLIEWIHFFALTKVFFAESGNIQLQFNAVNSVYWSIAIEIQFYVMIFLFMSTKTFYKPLLAILTIFSIIHLIYPLPLNAGVFLSYWPMFATGILLAYVFKNKLALKDLTYKRSYITFFSSIFFSALALAGLWLSVENLYGSVAFGLLFAGLLWAISPLEDVLTKYNNTPTLLHWLLKPLVYLGAMSYSVYLLHGKVYQLSEMFVRQIFNINSPLYGLSVIVLTLLFCFPFYLLVEKRFMSSEYNKRIEKSVK